MFVVSWSTFRIKLRNPIIEGRSQINELPDGIKKYINIKDEELDFN